MSEPRYEIVGPDYELEQRQLDAARRVLRSRSSAASQDAEARIVLERILGLLPSESGRSRRTRPGRSR